MSAKSFRVIEHLPPPYLQDVASADFYLFPILKKQLAGKTLTQVSFKSMWEGAARIIAQEDFAAAFRR
jgi:hypothetical protein